MVICLIPFLLLSLSAPLITAQGDFDPPPPINTPEPLHLPMISDCEQFHRVNPGETCDSIAASVGISVKAFQKLNPVLGDNGVPCEQGLMAGHWCCVKHLTRGPVRQVEGALRGIPKGFLTKIKEPKEEPPKTKLTPVTVTVDLPKPTDEPPCSATLTKECIEWGRNCPMDMVKKCQEERAKTKKKSG